MESIIRLILSTLFKINCIKYLDLDKSLLVSLLHCLYEAQGPSLCESVAQKLQYGLYLSGTTLTPSDCLCIGYFLALVCKMTAGEFKVYLDNCSIGDQGCKYLVSGLHKYLDTHSAVTTLLHIWTCAEMLSVIMESIIFQHFSRLAVLIIIWN